ncbi:MAG: HAD family hydrolase [Phycisphaerae bacterium]|nr:HAD family hydrolase [Phycisphaerae bacterium]
MGQRRFDALFIDYYGTLADGDRLAVETTCARLVEDLALPMTAAELAILWGRRFFQEIEVANHDRFLNLYDCETKTLVDTLGPLGVQADPRPYCDMLKHYWAAAPAHADAVAALAGLDLPVCCVSNADTDDITESIARHGFRFAAVVVSEAVRCYKPAPHIFRVALDALGVSPERVLHVGDSLHSDVGGAQSVGIATTWLCRDGRIFDTGQSTPDYKIGSLNELCAILDA